MVLSLKTTKVIYSKEWECLQCFIGLQDNQVSTNWIIKSWDMISGTGYRNIYFAKIWVSGFAITVSIPPRLSSPTWSSLSLRKTSSVVFTYLTISLVFLTWKSSRRWFNFQFYWVWFFTMVIFWLSFLQHKFLLTQIFSIKVSKLEAKKHSEINIYGQTVWAESQEK